MPSFQQLQFRQFLKNAGLVSLLLVVATVLYFTLQSDAWNQLTELFTGNGQTNLTEQPDEAPDESALSQFEEFLNRSSAQQLILRSTELVDIEDDEPLVRLDRQNKKVQIADRLLGMENDNRAVTFGIKSKLLAMRTREKINIDNGMSTTDSLDELNAFSQLHMASDSEDILKEARLGQLQSLLLRELIGIDLANITDATLNSFQQLCSQYPDDMSVATELLELMELVHVYAPRAEHQKIIQVFRDEYKESSNDNLKAMAARVDQRIVESEFELVNIFDSIDSLQGEAADKLARQIDEALNATQISMQGYKRIFNGVRDIASIGKYETAFELSAKLQSKIENKRGLQELMQVTERLRSQLSLAGEKFELEHVVDFEGEPFSIRYPEADIKAVLFFTASSFTKSDKFLFDVLRVAGRYMAAKRFCITAVFLDPGNNETALNEVLRVARAVPTIDFCRVDTNSDGGKEVISKIAMFQSPMMLLLDSDDQIVGLNVRPDDFERKFFELLRE